MLNKIKSFLSNSIAKFFSVCLIVVITGLLSNYFFLFQLLFIGEWVLIALFVIVNIVFAWIINPIREYKLRKKSQDKNKG